MTANWAMGKWSRVHNYFTCVATKCKMCVIPRLLVGKTKIISLDRPNFKKDHFTGIFQERILLGAVSRKTMGLR